MHLHISLPTSIANNASRSETWDKEIIEQVGGGEVRNELWSAPLRNYEIPFPPKNRVTDAMVEAIREVWRVTGGGVHSFDFFDEADEEMVKVRFDNDLVIASLEGPWVRVETVLLKEVRE